MTPEARIRPARARWLAPVALALLALWGCSSNDEDLQACLLGTSGGGTVTVGSGLPGDPAIPEPQSGYKVGSKPVTARNYMVVTANPRATQAGCEVLKNGGSAADAAVAVQMVLGLVEPQSSGVGGGAFVLHYNAANKTVQSYDGRETAPAAATENYLRWVSDTDRTTPKPELGSQFGNVRASGRAIGTPGAVRVLELVHQDHGKKAWSELFQPAIKLATDGFPISGRMAAAIAGARNDLLRDPDATAYFLNPDYSPKALGAVIKNPDYAATLNSIATGGANAFYTGAIAQSIVNKIGVTSGGATTTVAITPGLTTMADLANYKAVRRPAVCSTYRDYWVCGMGPPSSGGIAVGQALGILENFNLAQFPPTAIDGEGGKPSVMGVHLISEAERLAYADRNKYVADTDFVPLPGSGVESMLDKNYLKGRAALISTTKSMGTAQPGVFPAARPAGVSSNEGNGTTHVSIVDRNGNALVMTTTVESGMGSFHFTRGFLLNNQLTDFSFDPSDSAGPIANSIGPLKRPRSSMAPTLVFGKATDGTRGDFVMATGSPGGATIIQFVTKTLVGALDWKLNAQQATSLVNFGAANSATTGIGGEHPAINAANNGNDDPLVKGLRDLGHTVSVAAQSSGVSTVIRTSTDGAPSLTGGADPRREGLALGDVIPGK